MGFKLGSEVRQHRTSENTTILRKKLDNDVLGEANNDGTISINEKVPKGSALERQVYNHEKQHQDDMEAGILGYGDDHVRYMGKTYLRKDGKIKYNGKWYEEGDDVFPWEQRAQNAEQNV